MKAGPHEGETSFDCLGANWSDTGPETIMIIARNAEGIGLFFAQGTRSPMIAA